jgi:pimeloyl-ACP methyl ester carboxylesterase/putative sterol carrier protein
MARPATQAVTASLRDQRARRVRRAFAELPDRYRGAPADTDHTFQIRLGDVGRTWEVRTRGDRCEVHPSPTRNPDVVIGTDAATWIALREGRMSGLDAFSQRRLYARGDLDLALGFEGMFRLPGDRDPLLRISRAETGCGRVTTLIAGDGPEHVICLHGLGSNKSSFFETVAALAGDHTVHAIDLPGFGSSAKPARAPYDAPWFAAAVLSYMEATGLERAHLIGNSMGGRIAIEVGFAAADRVASLSLLSPSLAFRRRQLAPLVRLLRPELAAIPHPLREATVRDQFWDLFAQPERLDPAAADIAVDEFCRIYRSRAASAASTPASETSSRRPSSSGARRIASFLPPSRSTFAPRSHARSRSCSRTAATFRRWSCRSERTSSSASTSRRPRRPPSPSSEARSPGRCAARSRSGFRSHGPGI